MNRKRPINLDLTTIKFPINAISSILHRISGVIIFLLIPFFLWMLQMSLSSPESFSHLRDFLASPSLTIVVWLLLASLVYHLVAGIRHLFMDAHIFETLRGGRYSAIAVIIISIVLFIVLGVLLW